MLLYFTFVKILYSLCNKGYLTLELEIIVDTNSYLILNEFSKITTCRSMFQMSSTEHLLNFLTADHKQEFSIIKNLLRRVPDSLIS